jgi:hypothetical protein
MDAALAHLVDSGWLLPVDEANPKGRPRGDYLVNPAIHGSGK